MRFIVNFELFENITSQEDVAHARQIAGKQLQHIQSSGKLVEGGMFGDKRGGFFILDLDKAADLYDLLGSMMDMCRIQCHPVLSFQELGEFFKEHPVD